MIDPDKTSTQYWLVGGLTTGLGHLKEKVGHGLEKRWRVLDSKRFFINKEFLFVVHLKKAVVNTWGLQCLIQ